MTWILLALVAALGAASRDAVIKYAMAPGDEVPVAFLVYALAGAVLLPLGLLTGGGVHTTSFWPALLVSGGINAVAGVLIARAVHRSDISLVAPLQSTTPIFMMPIAWLLLGELPGPGGAAGIIVIAAGAYIIGTAAGRPVGLPAPGAAAGASGAAGPGQVEAPGAAGPGQVEVPGSVGPGRRAWTPARATRARPAASAPLAPLAALIADGGARLMLVVAALYAVAATVDKAGVAASTPLVWAGALCLVAAAALAPMVAVRHAARLRPLLARASGRLLAGGVMMALGLAAQMAALPLTAAAYVIAVKRTSVLFSVVAGGVFFRERGLARRLAGAAVMLAGFVAVTLLG